jgi:hypothetical protein
MDDPEIPEGHAELLARLGEIAKVIDPVPASAYELGRASFGLLRIDDELAALVADSALDTSAVRAQEMAVRLLSFEGEGIALEIQVSPDRSANTLLGQLLPSDQVPDATAHLETPGGALASTPVDDDGRFEFDHVPSMLVRIRVERPDRAAFSTGWLDI